jgi:2-polyprenyl-3-methyl-5-hydroxy-6-metoxy-1,4-benzoquinol methylase
MKLFYDVWYRFGTPTWVEHSPWAGQAPSELVKLFESGELLPGRAIDLGCGEGDNAIFLAQHGFQVTGIDFSRAAINKARAKAREAGAEVEFLVDDLTRLTSVTGEFDVIVDYGTFDDLSVKDRAAYVDQVLTLAKPGARFLLWCFEWEPKAWERAASVIMPLGNVAVRPGEIDHWFGDLFEIKQITGETSLRGWPRGSWAAYLLTRI